MVNRSILFGAFVLTFFAGELNAMEAPQGVGGAAAPQRVVGGNLAFPLHLATLGSLLVPEGGGTDQQVELQKQEEAALKAEQLARQKELRRLKPGAHKSRGSGTNNRKADVRHK